MNEKFIIFLLIYHKCNKNFQKFEYLHCLLFTSPVQKIKQSLKNKHHPLLNDIALKIRCTESSGKLFKHRQTNLLNNKLVTICGMLTRIPDLPATSKPIDLIFSV